MLTARTRSREEGCVTMPLCEGRKVSKPRSAPVKGPGFSRWDDVETANWRRYPDGSLRELRSLHTVLYTPGVINTPRLIEHDLATGAITSKGLRSNHCVAKRKVNFRQFAFGTKRTCRMRLRPMIGLKRYRNSDRRMPRSAIGTLLRKRSSAIRQS